MQEADDTMVAFARVRTNLALRLFKSAILFRNRSLQVEQENAGKEFGPFYEEIESYVIAAVYFSVAAVEAYTSELVCDAVITQPPKLVGNINYVDLDALIKARNALMHFYPEWDDEQKEHKKVAMLLRDKFPLSPFLPEHEAVFPKRCMTYGFAKWSVKTAYNFFVEFNVNVNAPKKIIENIKCFYTE